MRKSIRTVFLVGIGATLSVGSAWAADANSAAGATSLEEIVVTGSRVILNGDNSPTPLTIVSTEQALKVQPGTLADSLQILPVFSGSRGSGSNPSSTGTVGAGNGSANQLNLRNIGSEKTLVLMDGKRIPPTLNNGIVDVDSIPQMMVRRVDIVTGGASAVYGSDAVAGVVNYILDKDMSGVRVEAEGGISSRKDGSKNRVGVAWGTRLFDGRGHFEVSYEHQKEKGVLRRSDRDWIRQAGITGAGTPANPYVNQVDLRQSGFTSGGLIVSGLYNGQLFNQDGTLRPFVNGVATGTAGIQVGGDGAYYDSTLLAPLEFNQFFARLDYDFAANTHGYVQVGGNYKTNVSYGDNMLLQRITINSQNAFLRPDIRAALANANQTTFTLSELMSSGPRLGAESRSDQVNFAAGLDGTIGAYRWNVDIVHGDSKLKNTQLDNVNRQRLAAALDATTNAAGAIVCRSTVDPLCVPLNVFGYGAASAAALAYVQDDTHYTAKTVLDDLTASIAGAPLTTWAGPVNVALSGEWRRLTFSSVSDATPDDFVNCTGLTTNCTAGTLLWQNTFANTPKISNTVIEGALEASVPLLKDVAFAKSFDLNPAIRFTHYKTSGSYVPWKIGFSWQINDYLRMRATRSRDIRAPTLADLFATTSVSVVSPLDRLTNTSPRVPGYNYSNPDLKAEIGNTSTVGLVWSPLTNLSFAVDYYDIKVANAITQLQGTDPQVQDLCYASGGSSPYCTLQIRPNGYTDRSATNAVSAWISKSINLSEVATKGIDIEANFSTTLLQRPFSLRFLGALQPHIYYRQPGVETRDQAGAAFGPGGAATAPSVRLTGLIHFEPSEHFSIDLMERWRNKAKISGYASEVFANPRLPAFATTNLTLTYQLKSSFNLEVYTNIQNVFDATPPTGGFTGNGTRAGFRDGYPVGDNPMGRFYTAGVRLKL